MAYSIKSAMNEIFSFAYKRADEINKLLEINYKSKLNNEPLENQLIFYYLSNLLSDINAAKALFYSTVDNSDIHYSDYDNVVELLQHFDRFIWESESCVLNNSSNQQSGLYFSELVDYYKESIFYKK